MTHETIQILTACGNILAAIISIAAMISSGRSAKKAEKARDELQSLEESKAWMTSWYQLQLFR